MRLMYVSLVAACGSAPKPTTTVDNQAPAGAKEPSLHDVDWKNRTYDLGEFGKYTANQGELQFTVDSDGNQHDENWQPSNPNDDVEHGWLEVADPKYGDVDGDGVDEVAITTTVNTGGTGQFSLVTVYKMRGGMPVAIGTIPGGDRGDGGIDDVTIEHDIVMVDRYESVEGDGACCPSTIEHEQWTWSGGAFVENEQARTTSPNNEGGE